MKTKTQKRLKKMIFGFQNELKNTKDTFKVMMLEDKIMAVQDRLEGIPDKSISSAGRRNDQTSEESDKEIFKTHWSPQNA